MTWHYGFALDPGIRDRNGISVIAWREHDRCAYVVLAYAYEGTPTDVYEEIKRLQARYEFDYMVCDQGGMGLAFAEEFRRRYHLPIEAADKSAKAAAFRLLNAELKSGYLKVVRSMCTDLLEEWDSLPWATNGMREAEGYKADVSDSVLYNWRRCMAFVERPKDPPLTQTESFQKQERDLIERLEAEGRAEDAMMTDWLRW